MMMDRQLRWKFPIGPTLIELGAEPSLYQCRTGRTKLRCPFHDDSRPSASIDWDKQRFTCFACGVGGDAVDLFMCQEGLTRAQARDRAEGVSGTSDFAVPAKSGLSLWD